MEAGQPVGHRDEDRDEVVRREPPADAHSVRQRSTLAELHDEERLYARRRIARIDVEDGDDTRMRRRGKRSRLALEPAGQNGISGMIREEDLHRDIAVEPLVPRLGGPSPSHPNRAAR